MSASLVHYRNGTVRSVSMPSAFLRHLNTSTLALALFVAFALLNTIHGKEPETRDAEPESAIGVCDTSLPARQEIQGHKFSAKDFGNKIQPNQ